MQYSCDRYHRYVGQTATPGLGGCLKHYSGVDAMNRTHVITAAIILGGAWLAPASAQQVADFQSPKQSECVPGELLVKHRGSAASAESASALQRVGAETVQRF